MVIHSLDGDGLQQARETRTAGILVKTVDAAVTGHEQVQEPVIVEIDPGTAHVGLPVIGKATLTDSRENALGANGGNKETKESRAGSPKSGIPVWKLFGMRNGSGAYGMSRWPGSRTRWRRSNFKCSNCMS